MTIRRQYKNNSIKETIDLLYRTHKEKDKDIYKRVAEILNKSKRQEAKVNLFKLEKLKNVMDGSIVVIPGKLLGVGDLNKKVTIYAYSYSESAKSKFKNIKSIQDFCKDDIDYKKTVIIK